MDALRASVKADPVVDDRPIDYDVTFVDVRDVNAAEVVDYAVISELIAMPVASLVADADVAEAVIHSAIEADVASPVTAMEAVATAVESPIAGSPESAFIRRLGPCAGNPVIALRRPIPVTRGPQVARLRNGRLLIFGKCRRGLRGVFLWSVVVTGFAIVSARTGRS